MIVLQVSSHSLEAKLAATVATNPLDVTVVYYDLPQRNIDAQQLRYASQESAVSSATAVTIANAPGEGLVRYITNICVFNRDTSSFNIVTILKNLTSVSSFYKQHNVSTGLTLEYSHGYGWQLI